MTNKKLDTAKQYILLILVTGIFVAVYLILYKVQLQQFITFDQDKAIDPFILKMIDNGGMTETNLLRFCEYNLQNVIIYFLCQVSGNIYVGINIYYIISFFLISTAMFWYVRKYRISLLNAVFVSVLTAFLPYHINRGEGQIITSTYFMVPIFLGIIHETIFQEENEKNKSVYTALMCVSPLIDAKLSAMMLILMVILTIHRCRLQTAKKTAVYMIPMLLLLIILNFMTGVFSSVDVKEGIRLAREEGLRIMDMLMPMRYHFIGRLSDFRVEYDVTFSASGESGLNSLGMLLTFSFLFGMLCLFFDICKDKRIKWISWIIMFVILISNVRGMNLLFEYFGLHIIYWNRMAIFILVGSAAILGILADHLKNMMQKRIGLFMTAAIFVAAGIVAFMELLFRQNMPV